MQRKKVFCQKIYSEEKESHLPSNLTDAEEGKPLPPNQTDAEDSRQTKPLRRKESQFSPKQADGGDKSRLLPSKKFREEKKAISHQIV